MSKQDSKARWSDGVETRRYSDVPTEEVSESYIIEVLSLHEDSGARRPPTAPRHPPMPRLIRKIRLPKPGGG